MPRVMDIKFNGGRNDRIFLFERFRVCLRDLPTPVDLLLLDGWKDLYLPVLELVAPRLRPGAQNPAYRPSGIF